MGIMRPQIAGRVAPPATTASRNDAWRRDQQRRRQAAAAASAANQGVGPVGDGETELNCNTGAPADRSIRKAA